MPSKLRCDGNGACQGCQTSFLARFGNAFYVEFALTPLRHVAKTLVIVEALFLGECLRGLGWCSVVKHWVHLVMLWRIENEVMRIAEDFNAGLGAENNIMACLLSLTNAKQRAL